MRELRLLADRGRTVVVVTHSVLHLDLCDYVHGDVPGRPDGLLRPAGRAARLLRGRGLRRRLRQGHQRRGAVGPALPQLRDLPPLRRRGRARDVQDVAAGGRPVRGAHAAGGARRDCPGNGRGSRPCSDRCDGGVLGGRGRGVTGRTGGGARRASTGRRGPDRRSAARPSRSPRWRTGWTGSPPSCSATPNPSRPARSAACRNGRWPRARCTRSRRSGSSSRSACAWSPSSSPTAATRRS